MAGIERKIIQIDVNINDAIAQVQRLRVEIDKLTAAGKNSNSQKQQEKQLTAEVSSAYQKLSNDYEKAKNAARELAVTQGMQSAATKEAMNSANKLGSQLNDINKTLSQGKTDIMAFSSALTIMPGFIGQAAFAFQRLGVIVNTLFLNPIFKGLAIIGGLIGGLVLITKQSMKFSFEMAKVRAVTGATNEEFEKLRKTAIEVGATTMKTAVEVAQLQFELGKLGFAAKDINEMTRAITQLSVATTEDLASSSEVAGSVIRAFGLEAKDAQRVVDVMSKSFMTSALNLQRFRLAMTYVGPIARQAGLSLEETTAVLAVLSNNMVVGSKSGTAIRRIISELGTYAGGLTEKIEKLSKSQFGLAEAEDEVGRYAMTALTALVQNAELLPKYTEAMKNAAGATDQMAAIMSDTLTGDIIYAKSAWESFLLQIENGEGVFAKIARFFIQVWTGFLTDLRMIGKWTEGYLTWMKELWTETGKAFQAVFISIIEPLKFLTQSMADFITTGNFKTLGDNAKKMGENIKGAWDTKNWLNAVKLEQQTKKTAEAIRDLNKAVSPEEQKAINDRQNALRKYVMSEADVLKKEYEDNLDELKEFHLLGSIDTEEYNKGRINLEKKYQKDLKDLKNRYNSDNQNMVLAQFDYEAKIMEAQAKSLEVGREKEIALAEADYTKKINMSKAHIDKLIQQEKKGVKGATLALAEARRKHADYEVALAEEKNRKILDIELKYLKRNIDYFLKGLESDNNKLSSIGMRSAKQVYNNKATFLKLEYDFNKQIIENELIDEREKVLKLELLNKEYNNKKAINNEEYRKNQLKQDQTILQNQAAVLESQSELSNSKLTELSDKRKELLKSQMDEEILQAGDNLSLRLSIEQKYAEQVRQLDKETTLAKIDNFNFWAKQAMGVAREINTMLGAFGQAELANYAKTIKGKANYDELYAAKKLEIEIQAAKREKALGIFDATINTASAIIKALADPGGAAGVALSIAAGITGAAQIATIAATPLPTASYSSSSNLSSGGTKSTVTEKFHTGTYRPASQSEEQEITRTLLTTERVLSPAQTSVFDSIIGRMQSFGGSGSITSGVGVSQMLEEQMIQRAMTNALRAQKSPVMSWAEFENQKMRQEKLKKNTIIG